MPSLGSHVLEKSSSNKKSTGAKLLLGRGASGLTKNRAAKTKAKRSVSGELLVLIASVDF